MKTNRRSFLMPVALAASAVAGLDTLISGCGGSSTNPYGSSGSPTTGGNCEVNGTSITIELVHTPNHTLTVPAADVVAGTQQTYTLADNGSGHTHQVTITAADFTKLQQNQGIQETSTLNGHTHLVTVNCA